MFVSNDSPSTGTSTALQSHLSDMIERRKALSLLGGGSVALLSACSSQEVASQEYGGFPGPPPGGFGGRGPGGPPPMQGPHDTISHENGCVAHPTETNGPYPADGSNRAKGAVANVLIEEGIVRKDIRSSFAGMTGSADGVPLDLVINLVDVKAGCTPLVGYAMYLWHCDALGEYSVYDAPDANWLRGVGVSDQSGRIRFKTIFPGCYPGRYPHFHFEVYDSLKTATHYNNRVLVSQIATPYRTSLEIYKDYASVYGNSLSYLDRNPIDRDNVFGDNNPDEIEAQMLSLSGVADSGLTGHVTVGLAI